MRPKKPAPQKEATSGDDFVVLTLIQFADCFGYANPQHFRKTLLDTKVIPCIRLSCKRYRVAIKELPVHPSKIEHWRNLRLQAGGKALTSNSAQG